MKNLELKDYCLDEVRYVKRFGKVFCRKNGEHLGWLLFKIPFKIEHHNSIIKGTAQYVVVLLRNYVPVIIEEYQVDPISVVKTRAKRFIENEKPPVDQKQLISYKNLIETYNEVLKF